MWVLFVVGHRCCALRGSVAVFRDARVVNIFMERGAWNYKSKFLTATGVNDGVLARCLRNGEEPGGFLNCIFCVLGSVSDGACSVVVYCKSGKRRSDGAGAIVVS